MEIVESRDLTCSCTKQQHPLLLLLNHVSFTCKSVSRSVKFYDDVLGFELIKRPFAFDNDGAWLFNHGTGIHLLEVEYLQTKKGKINPKDNHISFQTPNTGLIIEKLKEMKIEFVIAVVKEVGIVVDQLFSHDPDENMSKIYKCQNLPVLPISLCPLKNKIVPSSVTTLGSTTNKQTKPTSYGIWSKTQCSVEVEAMMMYLAADIMNISF